MTFNEKLRALRKEKGWSQERLAQEVNVSRQAVTKWENGEGFPEIENLKLLSILFDKSIDELIKDDVKHHPTNNTSISPINSTPIQKGQSTLTNKIRNITVSSIPLQKIQVIPTHQNEISAELYSENKEIEFDKKIALKISSTTTKVSISVKKNSFINLTFIKGSIIYNLNMILVIKVPNTYMNNLKVDSISSEIMLENLTLNTITIDSTGCTISLENMQANLTRLKGIDNAIDMTNYEGDLNIDTVSADINIHYKKFDNSIKIDGIASEIRLDLPIHSQYSLKQNSINSDIEYNVQTKSVNSEKTRKNKIELNGIDNKMIINKHE